MTYPFGPTVTQVKRTIAAQPDADGNDTYAEASLTYQALAFVKNASTEVLGSQDTVTVDGLLTLPAGTAVSPLDAFTIAGVSYEVDGAPSEPVSPWDGWNPGVVVKLKQVTG